MVFGMVLIPIKNRLSQSFTPRGTTGIERFTEVEEISAYIPQVKLYGYPFPLILCDLRNINNDYIGWTSPRRSHEYYSVINDIPSLEGLSLFAIAKQWIPVSFSSYGSMASLSLIKDQHQVI